MKYAVVFYLKSGILLLLQRRKVQQEGGSGPTHPSICERSLLHFLFQESKCWERNDGRYFAPGPAPPPLKWLHLIDSCCSVTAILVLDYWEFDFCVSYPSSLVKYIEQDIGSVRISFSAKFVSFEMFVCSSIFSNSFWFRL